MTRTRVDLAQFEEFPYQIFTTPWKRGDTRIFKGSIALFDTKVAGLTWLDDPSEFQALITQVPTIITDLTETRRELAEAKKLLNAFQERQVRGDNGEINRQGYCRHCRRDAHFGMKEKRYSFTEEDITREFNAGRCVFPDCAFTLTRAFLASQGVE